MLDPHWKEALRFVREHETLIELMLFTLAFAESIVLVSVFVPSTLIFIAIGALEGAANGALIPLVMAGAMGAVVGDIVSFTIGYRFRRDIGQLRGLRDRPELVESAHALVLRWGLLAIIPSKATGPLRPLVPMLAGATSMPWPLFLIVSAASSILWSVMVLVPAYYGFNAAI